MNPTRDGRAFLMCAESWRQTARDIGNLVNCERTDQSWREMQTLRRRPDEVGRCQCSSGQRFSDPSFQQGGVPKAEVVRYAPHDTGVPPAPESGEHNRWHSGQARNLADVFVSASVESLSYYGIQDFLERRRDKARRRGVRKEAEGSVSGAGGSFTSGIEPLHPQRQRPVYNHRMNRHGARLSQPLPAERIRPRYE